MTIGGKLPFMDLGKPSADVLEEEAVDIDSGHATGRVCDPLRLGLAFNLELVG